MFKTLLVPLSVAFLSLFSNGSDYKRLTTSNSNSPAAVKESKNISPRPARANQSSPDG